MKNNIALVGIVLVALGVIGYGVMFMMEKSDPIKNLKPVEFAPAVAEPQYLVTELSEGDSVESGYVLSGYVDNIEGSYGNWAPFEGQIGSYVLYASDDTALAESFIPVTGDSDWMTMAMNSEDIPFEATLTFTPGVYTTGYIVIKNENASGEPAFDKEVTINVAF